MQVIIELALNHTSDQHPWFQRARRAPRRLARARLLRLERHGPEVRGVRIIFVDTERSNWTWDEEAGAYYWHRFFSHQPDLNYDNPRVLEEILGVSSTSG
jgi:maltose alpha-D-glucosyltransferase / alpha-amylase